MLDCETLVLAAFVKELPCDRCSKQKQPKACNEIEIVRRNTRNMLVDMLSTVGLTT